MAFSIHDISIRLMLNGTRYIANDSHTTPIALRMLGMIQLGCSSERVRMNLHKGLVFWSGHMAQHEPIVELWGFTGMCPQRGQARWLRAPAPYGSSSKGFGYKAPYGTGD